MAVDSRKILRTKVIIDCPICSTQNRFLLEETHEGCLCEDCGFCFLDGSKKPDLSNDRCVFCESKKFYYESPFSLSIFGRDSVCYVCSARYKGVKINEPELRYSEEQSDAICKTDLGLRWQERIKGA